MILIIDDDAAVRSSLTFLLKTCGFPAGGGSGAEGGLGGSPCHGAGADLDGYELHVDYHG